MADFFEQYKKTEVTDTRRVIHTPSDIAKKAFFYIQEVGYLKSLKPHMGKRSRLDSFLYLVVLSGSGTICYDGNTYQVKAQDCFLLDCRNEYSHISYADDPWELLWLHYDGLQAREYYNYVISKNGYHFITSYLTSITDAIQQLITINTGAAEHNDLITSKLITDILTQSVIGNQKSNHQPSDIKAKLYQISNYIDLHFTESITLDHLSNQFFISKYHLTREFKKEYNQTIIQYVLTKRVTFAKELLRFTDYSIGNIAQICGIGDVNYFNKVFRRSELMTASEFRRRW